MKLSPAYVHYFICGLSWDAQLSGRTLLDLLGIACRATLTDTPRGRALVAHTNIGPGETILLPPGNEVTETAIHELCDTLLKKTDAWPKLTPDAITVQLLAEYPRRRRVGRPTK